ncbi:MAG: helix-turn-helix domain-containing protein, partial [Spirochaetia bacterium]
IQARGGLITINELTEKMGYSQRYLAMKFDRFVGLGPKTLAEIVRFQNRFVHLTCYGSAERSLDFDDDYYDQSHFTREFKRFSGLPPAAYLKASNEFLTLFYGGTPASRTR